MQQNPTSFPALSPPAFGDPSVTRPWLTYGILAVLCAIYIGELVFSLGPPAAFAPSAETLVALGGLNRDVILATHEWYRVFTGPLLHAGPAHLLFNGIALYFAGIFLERLVGRFWFFAFFAVGALGGAAMSLMINPPDITSVGASGAIMALFAALFTSSFRLPQGTPQRSHLQAESLRVLIPSLLPLASVAGMHVDIAAHLGGAITGAAMAFILLKIWPADSPLPPWRKGAAALALTGAAVFVASFAAVAMHYPAYVKDHALFIPDKDFPKDPQEKHAASADLLKRYPRDPRAHMLRAQAFALDHDLIDARFEMEKALPLAEEYRYAFGLRLANSIRVSLGVLWVAAGAHAEAVKAVQPVCHAPSADKPDEKTYDLIAKYHLCE